MRSRALQMIALPLAMLTAAGVHATEVPVAVSPGDASKLVVVESRCPTFSWAGGEEAKSYELVVYRVGTGGEEAEAVLRQGLPAPAYSWTPSLDSCLERGGQYAWSVRAAGSERVSEWSAPSLFAVSAGPTADEFQEALEVVRTYLAIQDEAIPPTEGVAEVEREAESDSEPIEKAAAPEARAASPTALKVDQGIEAASFTGDGSGLTSVNADTAADLSCSGCLDGTELAVGSIGPAQLATDSVRSNHIQQFAVGSSEIARDAVNKSHIAADAVGGEELAAGAVGSSELRADSVSNAHLQDNSVREEQIAGGAVGTSEIKNSAVAGFHIKGNAVTRSHIQAGAVGIDQIATAAVGSAEIAPDAVQSSEIADGSVHHSHLNGLFSVWVECNGECGDSNLDQICNFRNAGNRAYAVTCSKVGGDPPGYACGGDNACGDYFNVNIEVPHLLGRYCDDVIGWDAIVHCMKL